MDDPRHVNVRMHGATPPHVYDLIPREALFHGVQALRLIPVGGRRRDLRAHRAADAHLSARPARRIRTAASRSRTTTRSWRLIRPARSSGWWWWRASTTRKSAPEHVGACAHRLSRGAARAHRRGDMGARSRRHAGLATAAPRRSRASTEDTLGLAPDQSPRTTPIVALLLYQRAAPSWNGRIVLRAKFDGTVSAAAGWICIISSG